MYPGPTVRAAATASPPAPIRATAMSSQARSANTGESADTGMSAKKAAKGAQKSGSFWKELPILIVIALVLAFVIKTWVVQAFYIPSRSMEDTLLIGDRVLVNKLVYQVRDVKRGDVVVFNGNGSWDEETVEAPPSQNPIAKGYRWVERQLGVETEGKDYIKRVIGLPGDTVECCDSENRVVVNGQPLDEESYLFPRSVETHTSFDPVKVPEGRLWLMGDHRELSKDSRAHQLETGDGTVAEDHVVGRAFVLVWPLNRLNTLPLPDTFTKLNDGDAAGAAAGAAPMVLGALGAVPVRRAGRGLLRGLRRT